MEEIEVKFRISSIRKTQDFLKRIGAQKISKVFEENIVFDNEDRILSKEGKLLRLRKDDLGVYLTFKSPFQQKSKEFKEMEEIEIRLDDFSQAKTILKEIGFFPQRIYRKRREKWDYKNSEILIDQLSFGNFLEIEGSKKEIREIIKLLKLDKRKSITSTYFQLYRDYCREKGIKPRNYF